MVFTELTPGIPPRARVTPRGETLLADAVLGGGRSVAAVGLIIWRLEGHPVLPLGGRRHCRRGPVIAAIGATSHPLTSCYWFAAACSRILCVPVSIRIIPVRGAILLI